MFGRRLKLVGLAIGLAASGVAVLVANAQQQSFSPGALRGLFERYDANQDGEVTPGELKNDALFERLDSNRDGLLNLGEVRRALAGGGLRGKESEAGEQQEQLPHTEVAGDETKTTSAEDVARDADAVRQAPTVLKGADVGIGRQLPDFTFTSLRGESSSLSDCATSNAVVLVMTGTGCPLCLKYAPSLASLEQQYKSRGVQFLFVNPNESESVARVQQAVDQHGLEHRDR